MGSATRKIKSTPAPKIHPELVAAVKVKKKPKQVLKAKAKPKTKASVPKHKRVQLVSIRDADSVIDQTKIAFSVSAIGACVGILLGSSIPLSTYMIAHHEWNCWISIYTILILGGLLFSANSVFFWTKAAFRNTAKALGFVALVEGILIFSHIQWLSYLSLVILIGINAVSTGANLVLKPTVPKKQSWEI